MCAYGTNNAGKISIIKLSNATLTMCNPTFVDSISYIKFVGLFNTKIAFREPILSTYNLHIYRLISSGKTQRMNAYSSTCGVKRGKNISNILSYLM